MPVLITSDIHGSRDGVRLLQNAIRKFRPESIISAGDQCPDEENASFFSSLIAVRGNCDRFYEYGNIPFPPVSLTMESYGHRITVTHGDRLWLDDFQLNSGDIFISGHTHVPILEMENGIYICNPGSPSRPRSSEGPSAALLDDSGLSLISLLSLEPLRTLPFL